MPSQWAQSPLLAGGTKNHMPNMSLLAHRFPRQWQHHLLALGPISCNSVAQFRMSAEKSHARCPSNKPGGRSLALASKKKHIYFTWNCTHFMRAGVKNHDAATSAQCSLCWLSQQRLKWLGPQRPKRPRKGFQAGSQRCFIELATGLWF